MNFDAPLLKPIRILLFPFSILYGLIIWIRNRAFDTGLLDSTSFNLPVICVGNLSVGGTGKSPMIELLVRQLSTQYRVAVLSRGYKRKTRGFALAGDHTTALEIGDEPALFHQKFPDITVAVGEERVVAIPQLLHERPDTEIILLDDAFQHRSVKAGFNIVLTDFSNLYTRDWFLPTGDLRDEKQSSERADLIVVTKCPSDLSASRAEEIREEIAPSDAQELFFTTIRYGIPYHLTGHQQRSIGADDEVLLVTGIANPAPLKQYLAENSGTYYEILFDDHHIFTIDDWKEILKRYNNMNAASKFILTTEKDAVRLLKFGNSMGDIPLYVLPIDVQFLFEGQDRFHELISKFIREFRKTK